MRFIFPTLATALFLALTPAQGQDFSILDWSMSCNDERYCIARANGSDGMQLKIERTNKADSNLFVTVRAPAETPFAEGMQILIDVLGIGVSESTTVSRVYRGNEITLTGTADRPLIDAFRAGNRGQVTVRFGGTIGTRVYDVPLTGVTSALAEMDRQQGRDDRTDAIVLRGGTLPASAAAEPRQEPQSEVSDEPSAPTSSQSNAPLFPPASYADIVYLDRDLPEAVLMTGYRVFDCDFPYVLEGYGAQVVGVTDQLELWMVPCNPADVNVDYYVSFSSGDEAEYYEFLVDPRRSETAGLVVNPQWNNETRQLTTWSYYGPDGDCGSFATYQYVTEDDAFDMISFREKETCDGVLTLPENYPLVWTAR